MDILPALPSDHLALTHITKCAKAYWGYSNEQMLAWDKELTIPPTYIKTHNVFKLLLNNAIIGYYAYEHRDIKIAHLENLFILPKFMGQGYGQLLLEDCINRVKTAGYSKLNLDSDPPAKGFYVKLGFSIVGHLPSSIEGRFLPIMEKEL